MNVGATSSASVQQSTAASAAQEAAETTAQTKAEAAKGDQQAVRRLARVPSADVAPKAAAPTGGNAPESTGLVINVKA